MTIKIHANCIASPSASGSKSACFLATIINPPKKAEGFRLYLVLLGITSTCLALSRRSAFGVVHFSAVPPPPRTMALFLDPSSASRLLTSPSLSLEVILDGLRQFQLFAGCPSNTRFSNATCKTAFPQSPRLLLLPYCC